MAAIVAWLIGALFLGIGAWILILRFEGLVDLMRPHNVSIGRMTVDGQESKSRAELFRARFDYHFRRPAAIPKETGFLELAALDSPDLFQPKELDGALEKMTMEVSGVDVAKFLQWLNDLAKPDQWVIEGDFQAQSDRALLALRLSRGQRLIRTWYLERRGPSSSDASKNAALLDQLVDDAVFQLVYDFQNEAEQDAELRKWRRVIPAPTSFPSRFAVAAYYEGQGALGRYYAHGDWADLDVALAKFRALRGQMPEFEDGLQLLAIALAEKRNESEAIHVYEQLRMLLSPSESRWEELSSEQKGRILSIDLLKATATSKLYTWQSTHEAIKALLDLDDKLQKEQGSATTNRDKATYAELRAHAAAQLAYTYALYLAYLRSYTAKEVFANPSAPRELRVTDEREKAVLSEGPPDAAKQIVIRLAREIQKQHEHWIEIGEQQREVLVDLWDELNDGERRQSELESRLHLASGYADYRMAEWESDAAKPGDTVFGEDFATRLKLAAKELSQSEAAHPNHYLVLQLLGLVYSEPRRNDGFESIAEQYFERAIEANPSDYYSHELLADLLLRKVANRGVDLTSRETIDRGLREAQTAKDLREISGTAHLLGAEFQTMLLEFETDEGKQRELRAGLAQHLDQAERFLPRAFGRPDPELTWMRLVNATRRLGDQLAANGAPATPADKKKQQEAFAKAQQDLIGLTDQLLADCKQLKDRWVAQQRVFVVETLADRVRFLRDQIVKANADTWRDIRIPFV